MTFDRFRAEMSRPKLEATHHGLSVKSAECFTCSPGAALVNWTSSSDHWPRTSWVLPYQVMERASTTRIGPLSRSAARNSTVPLSPPRIRTSIET